MIVYPGFLAAMSILLIPPAKIANTARAQIISFLTIQQLFPIRRIAAMGQQSSILLANAIIAAKSTH